MQVRRYAYAGEEDVQPGSGCAYVTLPEPQVLGSTVVVTGDSRPLTYYKNDGMYDAFHRDREKAIWLRVRDGSTGSLGLFFAGLAPGTDRAV